MRLFYLFLVCMTASRSLFANDVSVVQYLPKDCEKQKPQYSRRIDDYRINYVKTGTDALVAREIVRAGQTERLEMWENGSLHGIQREWHKNGKLKSESPYEKGVMHGRFKVWDEQGNLVGNYTINQGTGTRLIYQADGKIAEMQTYINNKKDGITYFAKTFKRSAMAMHKNDMLSWYIGFNENETLFFLSDTIQDANGISGVTLNWDHDRISHIEYQFKSFEVSEQKYVAESAKDPSIPAYQADPEGYIKKIRTPEVMTALRKYRNAPPVKIPLDDPEEK